MTFLSKCSIQTALPPDDAKILYLSKGFTLFTDYFMSKMNNDYSVLRVSMKNAGGSFKGLNFKTLFNLSDKIVLFPETWGADYIGNMPDCGCALLLHELLPKDEGYINHYNIKELWSYGNYIAVSKNSYESKTGFWEQENCLSVVRDVIQENFATIKIYEELIGAYNKFPNSGTILTALFEKYFGDNVIIPYDMQERKKLYPLAFEELKDYMKLCEK